ncbi:dihydrolipoamide acetyltransferase family protein [Clostridium sp. DL1XJH146]
MAIEVIMPKAGMDMEEGTIVKWFKNEGDIIKEGDPLLEIITDKVNMEVEAEVSGILLKILAKEDEVLPVFTPIAYIGQEGEKLNVAVQEEKAEEKTESCETKSKDKTHNNEEKKYETNDKKLRATPYAKSIARQKGIDLSMVNGSGPKGRIQKIDVISYYEQKDKITPLASSIASVEGIDLSAIKGTGHNGKIMKSDVLSKTQSTNKEVLNNKEILSNISNDNSGKIVPLSAMRKVIGKRMSESFFSAPTFTAHIEVDMTKAKEARATLRDSVMKETGAKLTFTDMIIMASAKALKKNPIINSSLVEEGILFHDHVSIALAVGLEEGLLVPVIKDVDKMTLSEITAKAKDISSRAVKMKLLPSEQEGSTFTISNMGMYGINHFNPIINQPNSGILGVSAMIDRPVIVNGEIKIHPMMNISITIDHRVIDGTPAAKFLQDLKQLLENPVLLIV